MNIKRYTARTAREALVLVREALGDDAVVLSTKPCADGVEVLAMAPEGMAQIQRLAESAPAATAGPTSRPAGKSLAERSADRTDPPITPTAPSAPSAVADDVAQLSMSTLSFQDYVRERMLRRRQAAQAARTETTPAAAAAAPTAAVAPQPAPPEPPSRASVLEQRMAERSATPAPAATLTPTPAPPARVLRQAPRLRETLVPGAVLSGSDTVLAPASLGLTEAWTNPLPAQRHERDNRQDQQEMLAELRSMKGLIEERFDALAYIERLQRQPAQARLTQKLLEGGFSPALIRKIADGLAADAPDEIAWAATVLEHNLTTAEADAPLEDQGGVYALVGATGVGKTTTTAKIAAAFATKYGASNLGLITLDAYRLGAHEQLRAYGRILGVPVHTAHDRASLDDLLELLSAKKMVLIDTAGMAQRDTRTRELLDMLSHRAIKKLLVVNAASQGETIEDVLIAYRAATCAGIVLSKLDEAVKLGPALDALIRHRLKLIGVANGQRVPEDWHRLSASALVHRAMRTVSGSAYKLEANEVSLIFAASPGTAQAPRHAALHA